MNNLDYKTINYKICIFIANFKTMKKYIFTILMAIIATAIKAQQHQLVKIWETDSVIATPESVLADAKQNILYVSLIDGEGNTKDGKGGIAKLGMDGKIIDTTWVTGMNAPKGMGKFKNELYVSDIDEVVIVDIKNGKTLEKITIPGAKFLNDVDVDKKGIVYVSDSQTGKVHKIENRKQSVYLEDVKGVNGVKVIGNDLFVLGGPILYKVGADKQLINVAGTFEAGGDGLEPLKNGNYIVSCWPGLIYYVTAEGKIEKLLDSRSEKINTADIGINTEKNIIYVPTFFKKTVAAYEVK